MTRAAAPRLCVALPTRDRRRLALAALDSVVGQLRPDDELIVVDNGSTDGTADAVLGWLAECRPSGFLVAEPRRSLSLARNAALRAATAPVVCFLDDDERADPAWLDALRRAWAGAGPWVAAIGGPMRAAWGAPRPPWLADSLLHVVSVLDLGPERRRLDQAPGRGYLWGGNMSFRREAVIAVGGFEPDWVYLAAVADERPSRRPPLRTARSGEEEELQRRLAAAGYDVWYEPAAAVDHLVPPERLTTAFFRDAFRQGGLLAAARGRRRAPAFPVLARSAARYAALRAIGRRESASALFPCAYAWALMTAPRLDRRPRSRRKEERCLPGSS